jgi:hypothetical protein
MYENAFSRLSSGEKEAVEDYNNRLEFYRNKL